MAEPNARFRQNVRIFYMWLGSLVLLGATPLVARRLAESESLAARIAAVAIGAGGAIPWIAMMAVMIRRSDEFQRQMHLVALGIAFGGSMVAIATLNWLARAGFIEYPDLLIVWVLMLVIWLIAMLITNRVFQSAR